MTRHTDASKVIGYIRVSKGQLGPEVQRTQLETWCRTHGAAPAFGILKDEAA